MGRRLVMGGWIGGSWELAHITPTQTHPVPTTKAYTTHKHAPVELKDHLPGLAGVHQLRELRQVLDGRAVELEEVLPVEELVAEVSLVLEDLGEHHDLLVC